MCEILFYVLFYILIFDIYKKCKPNILIDLSFNRYKKTKSQIKRGAVHCKMGKSPYSITNITNSWGIPQTEGNLKWIGDIVGIDTIWEKWGNYNILPFINLRIVETSIVWLKHRLRWTKSIFFWNIADPSFKLYINFK